MRRRKLLVALAGLAVVVAAEEVVLCPRPIAPGRTESVLATVIAVMYALVRWTTRIFEGTLEWPDGIDRRRVLQAANRLLALVLVGLFAFAQFGWYSRALSGAEPNLVLGPLYFLVNASSADDWIGYALLTVTVPCSLAVVFRQNRWTALAASLTAWAWVLPGTMKVLVER
jgi:hypothetical protein